MVERYDPTFDDVEGVADMEFSEMGDFVKFEDYDAIADELREKINKIASLEEAISDFQWTIRNI